MCSSQITLCLDDETAAAGLSQSRWVARPIKKKTETRSPDSVATIPQFGPAECLNTGVACAIALYELSRRRPDPRPIAGAKFRAVDGRGG